MHLWSHHRKRPSTVCFIDALFTVLKRGWLHLSAQAVPSLDRPAVPSPTFLCLDYFSSFLKSHEDLSPPGCLFCVFHPRLNVPSLCSRRPFCKKLHSVLFRWSGDLCDFHCLPAMRSSQRVRGGLNLSPISWEKVLDIFCNKQIDWLSLLPADSEKIIRYNRKLGSESLIRRRLRHCGTLFVTQGRNPSIMGLLASPSGKLL